MIIEIKGWLKYSKKPKNLGQIQKYKGDFFRWKYFPK